MAFYLYQGNDIQKLAGKLGSLLFKESGDPFAEETVVVPTEGFAKWLSLEIANARGLCPQIDFVRPGRFLYSHVFNPMRSVESEKDLSAFVPDVLVWEIYEWLKECRHKRVADFVGDDELKRWQLSKRLSRLYDKYMTCRQDMLQTWEEGGTAVKHEDEAWQRELWLSLTEGSDDHFSAVCRVFMNMPVEQFVPRKKSFYVFGVSSLPMCHVDILLKLAESADIHFFMFNPCETLWNDVREKKALLKEAFAVEAEVGKSLSAFYEYQCNPLLGCLGRLGRDFFSMMLEHAWDHEADALFYNFNDADEPSLLRQIRRDIQRNVLRTETWAGSVDSISVHVCHSAMREVEVLKDQILRAFKEIEGLEPKDVRVLLPAPAEYAPFVDVVFGDESDNPLPFVIADKSLKQEFLECQAFLKLLTSVRGRFKASEVLDLLSFECVRSAFGLDENDVREAAALLKQAHLAWGLDGAFRQELGASDEYLHTWRFALDRLILGASMSGAPFSSISIGEDVCVPESAAEGNARIAGALAELVEQMTELRVQCNSDVCRTVDEWMDVLKQAVSVFFSDESSSGVCALQRGLANMQDNCKRSRSGAVEFPFTVLMNELQESMESSSAFENVVSGRITFCKFKSLGSVPAKVVCMMGMNDGAYPRVERRMGFDLSGTELRLGDASVKDEDRFAFLETVQAASERLVICYTGRSQKDNAELPPSIVVSDLLDTVATYCPDYRDKIIVEHPLHPFSPRYFAVDRQPGLINYSKTNYTVSEHINNGILRQPAEVKVDPGVVEGDAEVQLEQLISLLSAPAAYFYKERLGVSVNINESDVPADDEPFALGALESYSLNRSLCEVALGESDVEFDQLFDGVYRSGALPVYSDDLREKAEEMLKQFKDKMQELGASERCESQKVSIPLDIGTLSVTFHSHYSNGTQVLLRPSGEKGKDVLRAMLYHLAWCASSNDGEQTTQYLFVDKRKNEVNCTSYRAVDQSVAQSKLNSLIRWYIEGLSRPLCFDMNVCWEAFDKKKNELQPDKVNDKWLGSSFAAGSGAERVARSEFGDELSEEQLQEFNAIAKDVIAAVKEVRE